MSSTKGQVIFLRALIFFPVRQLCKKKVCVKSSTQETESFKRKTCTALFFKFFFLLLFPHIHLAAEATEPSALALLSLLLDSLEPGFVEASDALLPPFR